MQRHIAAGRAKILNVTLSRRWGRLFVSVGYALRTPTTGRTVAQPLSAPATVATFETAGPVERHASVAARTERHPSVTLGAKG